MIHKATLTTLPRDRHDPQSHPYHNAWKQTWSTMPLWQTWSTKPPLSQSLKTDMIHKTTLTTKLDDRHDPQSYPYHKAWRQTLSDPQSYPYHKAWRQTLSDPQSHLYHKAWWKTWSTKLPLPQSLKTDTSHKATVTTKLEDRHDPQSHPYHKAWRQTWSTKPNTGAAREQATRDSCRPVFNWNKDAIKQFKFVLKWSWFYAVAL